VSGSGTRASSDWIPFCHITCPSSFPVERVSVTTGIAQGPLIAVEGSLAAGDRVVIRGAERLRPGQTVTVQNG